MELKGIGYLRNKLNTKAFRVKVRYDYYEMKNALNYFKGVIPPQLLWMKSVLGWSAKSVDSLADRVVFREFIDDNFALNEIFQMNNSDILFDSAILSALISSCSFIYISADEDGYPRLQVIDGRNATGIIDPITYMLKEGYAVLERDAESDNPTLEAYFEQGRTTFYPKGGTPYSIDNPAPYPLLVHIIYRPDAKRPFGHSRISRACMNYQQAAGRTLLRSEVSSEFYSFPQKYVLGLSDEATEDFDKWKATITSFLTFTKDEEGEKPQLGQFSQQAMTPYIEELKMFASLFAGETGLTLDDLGFATENPSSAEAIKASHETLRLYARKAQRDFGTGFLNTGFLAACLRDNYAYNRSQLYLTKCRWYPIFENDMSALSGAGDAIIKISQANPDYLTKEKIEDLLGI